MADAEGSSEQAPDVQDNESDAYERPSTVSWNLSLQGVPFPRRGA